MSELRPSAVGSRAQDPPDEAATPPGFVLWPEQYGQRPEVFGGKAAALARLQAAGLPVPPWFVLSPDAFEASLSQEQREALGAADPATAPRQVLADVRPATVVSEALQSALARLCPNGEAVAVRSSAGDEDSVQHSFAGQFDSFLWISPERVGHRVADVWRSAFSARLLRYRREAGLPLLSSVPTVLIQRMVDADRSGVAFGADPVSGRRGICVVSAVYGLGSALVSGEIDGDSYHVDRDEGIEARTVVDKATAHRRADAGEGVTTVSVDLELRRRPVLDDAQIRQVAALARRAGRHAARPQDIEWAIADGELALLQSRPITSLRGVSDPDGTRAIWDNSNIVESYGGVTTPLTFSFARHAYEGVYRELSRLLGFSRAKQAAHATIFQHMLGLFRGRIYYNLLSWYRLLAALPGFAVNRGFMEQMMGVRETLPDDVVGDLASLGWRSRLTDRIDFGTSIVKLVIEFVTLPRNVRRFYRRLNAALDEPDVPLDAMRPDELVGHFRDLERSLLRSWDAPLVNDLFAMFFYGLLRRLTERWCDDADGTLQNDLLSGEGGMISTEPARRVRELAALAADRPDLAGLLVDGTLAEIRNELRSAPVFDREFQSYLERFGERCMEELKLESPTLQDDPLPLLRAVGRLARDPSGLDAVGGASDTNMRERAETRVDGAMRDPVRRWAFAQVLAHARARIRDRENLRFERTRLFGRVRRIFLELGRRFYAQDLLDDPRDIFYLELEEALGFVEGTASSTRLRDVSALRREEFDAYRAEPPLPDRFETRGVALLGDLIVPTEAGAPEPGEGAGPSGPGSDDVTLQGIGCCPGIVRGTVRIVRDPYRTTLEVGDILVADHTDPGWIILFPSAAGLLVERGSLLSHAAIVARELGLPTVVSLPGVTRRLSDGDLVELDGSRGTVRRLEPFSDVDRDGEEPGGAQ